MEFRVSPGSPQDTDNPPILRERAGSQGTLLHPGGCSQDTGYRILHATRGYRIQDTSCYKAKIQQGCRTHRIQDAGLIILFTAWRPLQAGAGGLFQMGATVAGNPPAPRCGDSDQGIHVGEWMVPHCYGIDGSEKDVLFTKQLVSV